MIKKILLGLGILFALSFSVPALANSTTENETEFTQEFGGLLVSTGNAVRLQTATDKDVVLAGSMIRVEAPIDGDVFAAGNEVQILDIVNGSVRAAGNTVTIDSEIFGNVMAVGSTVIITENAVVHGYVNAYGATIIIDGAVAKSVDARGDQISVNGILDGESYFEGSVMNFGPASVITSPTTLRLSTAPVFQTGAQGQDLTTFVQLTQEEREPAENRFSGFNVLMWFVWTVLKYSSFLLISIVLIALFPSLVNTVTQAMHQKMGKSWGWGALAFLVMPSALVVLALTVIGMPLSLVAGAAYAVSLVLAEIMTAILLGRWILKTTNAPVAKGKLIAASAVGLAIGCVVVGVPFVGWIVKVAAMMYGLGGLLIVLFAKRAAKGK